jgi:chemotaxis protein MotB
MKKYLLLFLSLMFLGSCVSKKQFTAMQGSKNDLQAQYDKLKLDLAGCERNNSDLQEELSRAKTDLSNRGIELQKERERYSLLEEQLRHLQSTNTNLLDRLSDLSVVSKAGAENIKKSLEAISEQSKYIKDLTSSIQQKDSLNLALVVNLKRSLANINDEDVTVEVKKGVVYISLSDKMLFRSGSAEINPAAEAVLAKIASVANDHKELDILVEGHTDNVPINTSCVADNWDLSTKRATAVVRYLQKKHSIAPSRMTAGGRGEFFPKTTNETVAGRSANRRTEIILLPQLDQFFRLLEPPKGQ